jgi:uncharacterized protein YqeY
MVSAPIHKMRHPREGAAIKTTKISIDPAKVLGILNKCELEIENRRVQFSECLYHELSYEDLVRDKDEELKKIQSFLNVNQADNLTSDLVKINPDSLAEVIENFGEISDVLSGTPYEKFLI